MYWKLTLGLVISIICWAETEQGDDSVIEKASGQGGTITRKPKLDKVAWSALARQSMLFTSIQHGFRLATEPGTREGFRGSYWRGWARSAASMHGWRDGDPFYVNYVGHPLQGATSGYLFVQNDPEYREEQFGMNRRYWRSRMRAMGFAWIYSTQFELGPFSEAMIGKIQATPPQQGFVDHVITPTVGVGGFMVAEDILDRYFIRWFETRVENPYARMMVRGGLNPSRSMANLLRGKVPWYRDSRGGILDPNPLASERSRPTETVGFFEPMRENAPYEFSADARLLRFTGPSSGGVCAGAGALAAMRLSASWQALADVGGCKLAPNEGQRAGDLMFYGGGPRWTLSRERWRPHFQLILGGQKVTLSQGDDKNAFALGAGGGVDVRLNRAIALRLANFEYRHAWMNHPGMEDYRTSVRFSSGLVLQMGSW